MFNFSPSGSSNINVTHKIKSSNTQLDHELSLMKCQQSRKYGDNWATIRKSKNFLETLADGRENCTRTFYIFSKLSQIMASHSRNKEISGK